MRKETNRELDLPELKDLEEPVDPTIQYTSTGGKLTKKHSTDAGWDIQSKESFTMFARERRLVSTGVSVAIPEGYAGLLWSRSGMSYNLGIQVGAGLIDSSYRGEVGVLLYNLSNSPVDIKAGERIAQLVIVPICLTEMVQVDELDETERGDGGFGSTGK